MLNSIHNAVGAIIIKNNKILLIKRSTFPKGFAFPAGHVEKKETPLQALTREVREETNLAIVESKLIGDEVVENTPCNKGSSIHHWFIFLCKVKGKIKINEEAEDISWIDMHDLKKIDINPTWSYWLKKLNYLKK